MKRRKKIGGKAAEAEMRNAAKRLLANIRFAEVDSPIRTVVVTSSVPNEGKSAVSVALAEAMAESGASVPLVDCDFRRRSLPVYVKRVMNKGGADKKLDRFGPVRCEESRIFWTPS